MRSLEIVRSRNSTYSGISLGKRRHFVRESLLVFRRIHWFLLALALAIMVAARAAISAAAQEELLLRITQIDAADFPIIRVNVITAGAQGQPLLDLSTLSLRENGIPIGDLQFSNVPVGVKTIFVIDTNPTLQEVDDDSGLTRQEKVRDSIVRYARQFMTERDRVSIIVPGEEGEGGRFLVENAASPSLVIEAIGDYPAESWDRTPLNEMLTLAFAHAADGQNEGLYQAVLLFSDGARLSQQLNFDNLVGQAGAIDLPVFAAILGARADENEISNVARLYEPTRGSYVHMPTAADTDPIYATWDRQRNQTQISYRSLQTKSGRYPIAINVGTSRAVAEFDLTISPADLSIALERATIRRTGSTPDSTLASLTPTSYPVPVALRWPDGIARPLATMTLLLDGQARAAPSSLAPDADGFITFELDISDLDQGNYDLVVQATDILGLSTISQPQTFSIEVVRPLPPTPTAVPTITPESAKVVAVPQPVERDNRLGLTLLAAAGLVAAFTLLRRRRRRKAPDESGSVEDETIQEAPGIAPEPADAAAYVAFLELLQETSSPVTHIRLEGDNIVVGRDHLVAQIVLSHPSVAKLHARIRQRDGQYWLYDEGSSSGTFHNHQRLGLVPQLLADQDTIRFGQVGVRFRHRKAED